MKVNAKVGTHPQRLIELVDADTLPKVGSWVRFREEENGPETTGKIDDIVNWFGVPLLFIERM